MKKLFHKVGLSLLVLSLVGCNTEKTRDLIDQRTAEVKQGLDQAMSPAPKKAYNPLVISDKVWAGNAALRMSRGIPLPAKYERARGVTLVANDDVSLSDIAAMITNQTGIPVRIASGAESVGKNKGAGINTSDGMPVSYEGPLSGLLDRVCGFHGINWRYDGTSLYLSRYETRVFMIEAMPGVTSVKDGIKEVSNASNTTSGTTTVASSNDLQQSSELTVELKVWEELEKTITALLNGTGSVVIAPSSGTVAVTTTPELMRTVAKFIEHENARMSRQVAINVEIYSVILSDEHDFTMTLSAAMDKLSHLSYTTAGTPSPSSVAKTDLGSLGITVLNTNVGSASAIFNALSSVGDTSRVAQFPLTTLNNRPVARRVGKDKSYVASISNSNSTSSSYSSSTVTPGTIQEGFSLQMTPRVLDDGRIMLQYSFSLIDLVSLTNFSTASGSSSSSSSSQNSYIQLPETANRVFVQQSMLKSGSTLIIGGFDDEQSSQTSQGVGNAFNYLLGGGAISTGTRTMLFIAITPQMIDTPRSEQE